MPVIELFIVAGLASEEEAEEGTSVSPSMTEVWLCQLSTAWQNIPPMLQDDEVIHHIYLKLNLPIFYGIGYYFY